METEVRGNDSIIILSYYRVEATGIPYYWGNTTANKFYYVPIRCLDLNILEAPYVNIVTT